MKDDKAKSNVEKALDDDQVERKGAQRHGQAPESGKGSNVIRELPDGDDKLERLEQVEKKRGKRHNLPQ